MVPLPLSLPSLWVSLLCSPGRFLGPEFPVVVPRCLVLLTTLAIMRFQFLVCLSLPPLGLHPVLLLPHLLTVPMTFPFRVSPTALP
jgi:hypothetical protein